MENQIIAVINKLREIYKYTEYKDILKDKSPEIHLFFKDDHIELNSIMFSEGYYGRIWFFPTSIVFEPDYGDNKTLITFESVEEFLNM